VNVTGEVSIAASADAEALPLPAGLLLALPLGELLAELSLLLPPQPLSTSKPVNVSNDSVLVLFHFIELPPYG